MSGCCVLLCAWIIIRHESWFSNLATITVCVLAVQGDSENVPCARREYKKLRKYFCSLIHSILVLQ